MATTKKSSKAKTKTSKSSVQQEPTKVVKTVKSPQKFKAVSIPDTAKIANTHVKKVSIRRDRTGALKQLNVITAVLSAGLAVLAGVFMNHRSYQLVTGLLTKDELASRASTVFVPATHLVYDLEIRYAVVAIMAASAILPLLYLTRFKRQYTASLASKAHLWRWLEMAIIGAATFELFALLSGVQDIMTLKLLGGLVVVSGLLAWLAEIQKTEVAVRPMRITYALSVIAGALPWFMIAVYTAATPLYGMVRNSWFVYALFGVGLLSFIVTALNLRKQLRRTVDVVSYEVVERNYLLINLISRVAFATILITGLIKS